MKSDYSSATEILFGAGDGERSGGVTSITFEDSRGVAGAAAAGGAATDDGATWKGASVKSGVQEESAVSMGLAAGEVPDDVGDIRANYFLSATEYIPSRTIIQP